ncbi:restriction endonuclease subunit S [Vibrio sp. Vb0301]|uniref:restriction endonuclease subunit S n=1 Tax=Vibrio sp. Vb0301 TaxID=3074622 RepID=UPI002963E4B0|nr:restriction endonuclease subunit S [Vibrio sp. Vb0301]MDW2011449.1 restriction endonuclease subunit S [Vibrio sp. Vb0301]
MVPNGWMQATLGDLVHKSAFGPRFTSELYSKDGAIGTIRTTDLYNEGEINYTTIPYADLDISQYEEHVLNEGDLLITRSGTCGIPCIFTEQEKPIIAGAFLIRFQLNEKVDSKFLHEVLKSAPIQSNIKRMAAGGVQKNLTGTSLKTLHLALPPLLEQRKIAKILSTWDKAISTTEKLIETSKQQKKALMQQLLTGKKRLVNPETGKVFEGKWEEVHIGDICEVNPKKFPEPHNGLVSFIPMDAVSEDAKLLRTEVRKYTDVSKGFTSFKDTDTLIAKITPCFENGKGAKVTGLENGVGFGSTEFHVLRSKQGICPNFVYFITNTSAFRVRGEMNMQGSAGQKRVTTDYLKLYKVSIPKELSEQQKIASALTAADKEIAVLEAKLAHFKQEKKALMQQLLTGKRRVKVDEMEVA